MLKKKLLSCVVICGLLTAPASAFGAQYYDNGILCNQEVWDTEGLNASLPKPVTVHVDGKYVSSDTEPTIKNGRVLIPLRAASEEMGATVNYISGIIDVSMDGNTARFNIGSTAYTVNGDTKHTDVAPAIVAGRTMVPIRVFSEAMGAEVNWNQQLYDVSIDTPAYDSYVPTTGNNTKYADSNEIIQKFYVAPYAGNDFIGTWERSYYHNRLGYYVDEYIFIYPFDMTERTYLMKTAKVYQPSNLSKPVIEMTKGVAVTEGKSTNASMIYDPLYHRGPNGFIAYPYITIYLTTSDFLIETDKYMDFGGGLAVEPIEIEIPYQKIR